MVTKRTNGSEAGFGGSESDGEVIIGTDGDITNDDRGDGIPIVEPSTIAYQPDANEQPSKRRGRPAGSRNAKPKATQKTSTDLTSVLVSLHFMAANLCKIPELNMEKEEAKRLAEAVQKVNELYGMPVFSEKQEAWFNLAVVGCSIYGPRIIAHGINKKKDAANKPGPKVVEGQFAQPKAN